LADSLLATLNHMAHLPNAQIIHHIDDVVCGSQASGNLLKRERPFLQILACLIDFALMLQSRLEVTHQFSLCRRLIFSKNKINTI
jgi:hypothetical protein